MPSTEKETQAAILGYLEARRIFHYRQNSGAYKTQAGGFVRYGSPGAPDIVCVFNGGYIGIEVKDKKGKMNENQEAFAKALTDAGGVYLVARSIDDVIEFFEKHV